MRPEILCDVEDCGSEYDVVLHLRADDENVGFCARHYRQISYAVRKRHDEQVARQRDLQRVKANR